jgi:ABC-type multidrug transport system ATPase subunit
MPLMTITATDAGKRFNRDWIFRKFHLDLSSPQHYSITGHNGSGKSTLIQCIAGSMLLSEGSITYTWKGEKIATEKLHQQVSIAAPYLELIEEMTALEFLNYHANFKPFLSGQTPEMILEMVGLNKAANKEIRNFSSGMKQRLKLAQAFFSDTPLLLLDEPCSNLDQQGIELYQQLIGNLTRDRLVIIGSNDPIEYQSCRQTIRMGV